MSLRQVIVIVLGMRVNRLSVVLVVIWGFLPIACTNTILKKQELSLLVDSSWDDENHFTQKLAPLFEQASQCSLRIQHAKGAVQFLSLLEEQSFRKKIDAVVGINALTFNRIDSYFYQNDSLQKDYESHFPPPLRGQVPLGFNPISAKTFGLIYKKADLKKYKLRLPHRIQDLGVAEWRNKIIFSDPRNTQSGLLFLLYVDGILSFTEIKSLITENKEKIANQDQFGWKMFEIQNNRFLWTQLNGGADSNNDRNWSVVPFQAGTPVSWEGVAVLNQEGDPVVANPCIQKFLSFVSKVEFQEHLKAGLKDLSVLKHIARGNDSPVRADLLLFQFRKAL